jgi:hypothetical protein
MIEHFRTPGGSFFDTSDDHGTLIVRPRELQDNTVLSGNRVESVCVWSSCRHHITVCQLFEALLPTTMSDIPEVTEEQLLEKGSRGSP